MTDVLANIKVLMDEHDNICRMLKILKHHCLKLLNDPDADLSFFDKFIDFTRNYADKHHHGKEELILFDYMVKHLGPAADKLVHSGMLVEHDLGRLYVGTLCDALEAYRIEKSDDLRLQILSASMGYADLLQRHVDKENQVVYPFAARALKQSLIDEIEDKSISFEATYFERKKHYESMLSELEREIC